MSGRTVSLGAVMFVLAGVGAWIAKARPWESPTERAYRECRACDIGVADVNRGIDDNMHSTLTREESVELYLRTFEDRTEAEPCRSCGDAVLDAAER